MASKPVGTKSHDTVAHTPADLLAGAREAQRAGQLPQALGLYRELARTLTPEAVEARRQLGLIAAQSGAFGEAIEHLTAASRLDPGNAVVLTDLGKAHLAARQPAQAVAACREALRRRPDHAEAHFLLANALGEEGHGEEAVASYRRAAELAPRVPAIHINLGVALQMLGRHDEAAMSFARALALDPRQVAAHFNLGISLAAQRRFDDAIAAYREGLRFAPGAAPLHVNLGMALQEQKRLEEAIACYRRAIELEPGLAVAYNNLGSALREQGRLDEAVAAYRTSLSIDPGAAPVHLHLGIALDEQHLRAEAEQCYRRAIELDPALAVAHNNLGSLLRDTGRVDEAVTAYREALRLDPDSAPVLVNLGMALAQRQDMEEAIECYERALAADPDLDEPHRALALAHLGCGRVEEAFDSYRRHTELAYGPRAHRPPAVAAPAPHKVRHDLEQRDELLAALPELASPRAAPDAEDPLIGIFHLDPAPRLPGPAVNPGNFGTDIEARYAASRPNIVVIDDFLTPEALAGLQRFCWDSTMWRRIFSSGYVGAVPETGFAAPLLAQVSDELRHGFPRIFRNHLLNQCWAFKYDSTLKGTNVHADFAAVNVNFWITPDEANLDPTGGGLVIWDVPAPLDWDFEKYNANEEAIRDFLARSQARSMTVPYRANRAIIFDSDLFHETDRITFKEGYRNRRINITLLYGLREHEGQDGRSPAPE